MIKKHWFNLLILLSLFFITYKLVSAGSLHMPVFISYTRLTMSVLFLLLTFLLLAVRWKFTLQRMGMEVPLREAVTSAGLPIFSKYIPGKVLMIVGKAGYLSKTRGFSLKHLSMAAFIDQLLAVVTGITLGVFFLTKMNSLLFGLIPGLLLISSVLLLLFHPALLNRILNRISSLLKKEIHFEKPPAAVLLKLLPLHLLYWMSASAGFFFLASSIDSSLSSPLIGLAFPFAVCAGIAALFAPGGLGVRETVLFGAFSVLGLNTDITASIVFISRFWFLAGELFIFILALLLRATQRKLSSSSSSKYINSSTEG